MSVVDFTKKRVMIEGKAKCTHCKHEWTAEAEPEKESLECPACHELRGIFKYNVSSQGMVWHCVKCQGTAYELRPHNAMCVGCGLTTAYSELIN